MTDVIRTQVLPHLDRIRPTGTGWLVSCPVPGHGQGRGDRNPSLHISPGDHVAAVADCKVGCGKDAVIDALAALGIDRSIFTAPLTTRSEREPDPTWLPCHKQHGRTGHELVAEYQYVDRHGRFVHAVTRCASKDFAQWRRDPAARTGRRWSLTRSLPDGTRERAVPLVPFRLPEVLAAIAAERTVWVVEGEKDSLALADVGIAATCNAGGVGMGWTVEHARHLEGADVVVVVDRDDAGVKHAEKVVETLLPLARSIEVVRAAAGKDAADHLAAGLGISDFVTLAEPKTLVISPGGPYPPAPRPTSWCNCGGCPKEGS